MDTLYTIIAVLIAVLLVVGFIALRSTLKRKTKKRCSCAEVGVADAEEKRLDAPIIMEKTVWITGICCSDCAKGVAFAFNRMDGVSATILDEKGEMLLRLCRTIDDEEIRSAVSGLGFSVKEIQTKHI